MCLQTFHGVEKTPLFYYNNQHQEKRFGGSKKGIRFSKKFFETHRKPHGYWVPVISVTKDKLSLCRYAQRNIGERIHKEILCYYNTPLTLVIISLCIGLTMKIKPIYKEITP